MSGRLTIWIDGREALPVRAIPYVTGWHKLTPDVVARYMMQDTAICTDWHTPLSAFHYVSGKPVAVASRDWEGVTISLKGLEAELREMRPDVDPMDDPAGYATWRDRAALKLPAGVWVWLDEFERMYQALDESMSFDDDDNRDNGLILAPMLATDTRGAVLEGFDNLHADPGSSAGSEGDAATGGAGGTAEETPTERQARLQKRANEKRDAGVKAWMQRTAAPGR